MPGASVYSATKAAVRSLARTLTAEIPVAQTRFNVLSPGVTTTDVTVKSLGAEAAAKTEAALAAKTPIMRPATAEEQAKAALFLSCDDSSYIAGFELVVDGGWAQV